MLEVFFILRSGEGLTSFDKAISANFSGEKKYIEAFRGVYFLRIQYVKTLRQILSSKSILSSNLKPVCSLIFFPRSVTKVEEIMTLTISPGLSANPPVSSSWQARM